MIITGEIWKMLLETTTFNNKKIIIFSPHIDDGELGCGGTINKLAGDPTNEIYYIAFSDSVKQLPEGFKADTLRNELKEATLTLGIDENKVIILDYETRFFFQDRQKILEEIHLLKNKIDPHIIFIPSQNDLHQDHQAISNEAIRCFKNSSTWILGYEQPWNCITFNTTVFSILSESNIQKKVDALMCYKSQFHRKYLSESFLRSLAITRGTEINHQFAEAFEIVRGIF